MLLPAQARLYQLQEGQVIQAVVKQNELGLHLSWDKSTLTLPASWLTDIGKTYHFMVTVLTNGYLTLKPINENKNKTIAGTTALDYQSMATAESEVLLSTQSKSQPEPLSLGEAFAALKMASTRTESIMVENDFQRLIMHNPVFPQILRLLNWMGQSGLTKADEDEWESADPDQPIRIPLNVSLLTPWLTQITEKNDITAQSIRQSILWSGLTTEIQLKNKSNNLESDLKVILRKILQSNPNAEPPFLESIHKTITSIERFQLDVLQAQLMGCIHIQWVLNLADTGTWGMNIFRPKPSPKHPSPPFCFDIHSRHSGLGPLWLRTVMHPPHELEMIMWAQKTLVANMARENQYELHQQLKDSHFQLKSLQIIDGIDPYELELDHTTGSDFDEQGPQL